MLSYSTKKRSIRYWNSSLTSMSVAVHHLHEVASALLSLEILPLFLVVWTKQVFTNINQSPQIRPLFVYKFKMGIEMCRCWECFVP